MRPLAVVIFLLSCRLESGFYVPGVAPVEFRKLDPIEVKAVKLTSTRTLLPFEYYSVPFCKTSEKDIVYKSENLGEILRGDRIVNTPFQVQMQADYECRTSCGSKDKPTTLTAKESDKLIKRIEEEYHVHLLIDNLPCATKVSLPENEVVYEHGYKLGYSDNGKVYLNNHLKIHLFYHEHSPDSFRVVGFEVEPRSVDFGAVNYNDDFTCKPAKGDFDSLPPLILKPGAENKFMWSYSVDWHSSEVKWASRWDSYLAMKDVQIHWFSIVNSIVVVLCLTGFIGLIMVRAVRRDIANYNKSETDYDETLEETGWKLVHGDVFRPPQNSKLLTSLVGSGLQIFGMALVTIVFAMLGMLSPSSRGSLMTVALFLYCFMGLIAGYFSGRIYKTIRGVQWKRAAFQTGTFFPAVVFILGFFLNFFIWGKHSSGAVPFSTMVALICMWFGISIPLVFVGFYFGYRKQAYQHPVRTNQIPRQVPEQPLHLNIFICTFLAGILPFGAMFIELFFIFTAIWENQFYYLFGFLFLVFVILVISCAQISVVVTYFQLCSENYHWWWRSFVVSGGSAFYVLAYSVYYYTKLDIIGFVPALLYFGYTSLMCLTFWLFTGTIGFYASYFFVCKIYGAVKID